MSALAELPSLVPTVDPVTLPIGPEEAFVLSQVNGKTSPQDIAFVTGFDETRVLAILQKLKNLGAVNFPDAAKSQTVATPVVEAARESVVNWKSERRRPPGFDEALLDEAGDIDRATKEEILDLFFRLDRESYYQILGVPADADKKAIKAAYFERVNVFHTDRFFGKDLGPFKARLERIFAALTKAHDTLTREKTREEYDRYWASRSATRGVRDSLPPSGVPGPGEGPGAPEIPRAPRAPSIGPLRSAATASPSLGSGPRASASEPLVGAPPSTAVITPRAPDSDPAADSLSGPESMATSRRAPDTAAARRLLAKKFGHRDPNRPEPGGSAPTPVASIPTTPVDKEEMRRIVSEQLRARYEARQGNPLGQVNRYLEMARAARAKNEWGSALNTLRIARDLSPEDARVTALLQEFQLEADRAMADQFVEQAKYEEADGFHDRAARSFERAARGKHSAGAHDRAAHLYERAAFCLMAAGGDKRHVVELARLGVSLDMTRAHARLTLARAYESAGMRTSALGEIARALELEPNNEEAKALQKQLK